MIELGRNTVNGYGNHPNNCAIAQKRKPPRLYLRRHKTGTSVWVIRHGERMFSTSFPEEELAQAEQVLASYANTLRVRPGSAVVPKPMMRSGWVYFVTCDYPDFPVKIGWAESIGARLKSLQCAMPYKIKVIAAFRGSMDDERKLHIGFHSDRLEGEWFRRTPDLMAIIDRHALAEAA